MSFFSWLHLALLCLSRIWCGRRRSWFRPTPIEQGPQNHEERAAAMVIVSNRPNLQNWHGLALINSDRPTERRIVLGGLRFVKLSGVGLVESDWPFYTFSICTENMCTGLQLIAVLILFLIVAVSWYNFFSLHCQGLDVEEVTNTSSKHPSMLIGVYSLIFISIIQSIILAKKRSESSFLFSCFFSLPRTKEIYYESLLLPKKKQQRQQ